MKVHHVIFIVWAIVFAGWAVSQFKDYNRRKSGDK
jgi:hypothetical protein